MHQCDTETGIHCIGKLCFRSTQHRYVAASNTYFWGTVTFVQVGFLYLIVTRHKLTVWNKYDACDQDQTGAPNNVMWKNNKSSWAGFELLPPASQFSILTGPLELETIKLHKAILGKDPSWGNKPWKFWMELIFSSPSFGNIKLHSWKLVTLSLGEYCFQIRNTRRLVGLYFLFFKLYMWNLELSYC